MFPLLPPAFSVAVITTLHKGGIGEALNKLSAGLMASSVKKTRWLLCVDGSQESLNTAEHVSTLGNSVARVLLLTAAVTGERDFAIVCSAVLTNGLNDEEKSAAEKMVSTLLASEVDRGRQENCVSVARVFF